MYRLPPTFIRLIWLAAIGSFNAATPCMAQTDLRTLLPPTVESVIYVPDVQKAVAEFRSSRFGEFYNEPRARDFLKPLREMLEGDSPELAALLAGKRGADHALNGSLLIARLILPGNGLGRKESKSREDETAPFVVIFHHNGDIPAVKIILESALPRDGRIKVEKDSVHGLEFNRIRMIHQVREGGGRPKNAEKTKRVDSLAATPGLKVAGREEVREEHHFIGKQIAVRASRGGFPMGDILNRIRYSSGEPSLMNSPSRIGAFAGMENGAAIQIYHDFSARTQSGGALVDESLLGRDGDVSRLGLDEIKSVGMSLYFSPERFHAEAQVFIPAPRRGLGRLFFMNSPLGRADTPTTGSLAAMIPDKAVGYVLFSADLAEVWSEFRRIFRESIPAASDLVDSYLDSLSKGLDADIERELIAKLGGRWVMFTSPVPGRSRKKEVETTYMIEIASAPQLRPVLDRWLSKTASTLNYTLETSEADGNVYYRITGAEVSEGAFADIQPFAKICLTPDWLVISPRFEHIQSALGRLDAGEGGPPPMPQWRSEEWSRAVGYLPADRFMEVYSSPGSFDSFITDPFLGMFTGLFAGLQDSVVEFDQTPKDDVWSGYFGPVAAALTSDGDRLCATINLVSAER